MKVCPRHFGSPGVTWISLRQPFLPVNQQEAKPKPGEAEMQKK
jgi:hypothetical protein